MTIVKFSILCAVLCIGGAVGCSGIGDGPDPDIKSDMGTLLMAQVNYKKAHGSFAKDVKALGNTELTEGTEMQLSDDGSGFVLYRTANNRRCGGYYPDVAGDGALSLRDSVDIAEAQFYCSRESAVFGMGRTDEAMAHAGLRILGTMEGEYFHMTHGYTENLANLHMAFLPGLRPSVVVSEKGRRAVLAVVVPGGISCSKLLIGDSDVWEACK